MSYRCRLCVQNFEKTNPFPEQRKEFFEKAEHFGYAQLYAHIETEHGKVKNAAGKLVKKVV